MENSSLTVKRCRVKNPETEMFFLYRSFLNLQLKMTLDVLRYAFTLPVRPLWKSDSFLWISDKKQIHLLKISDKKQTPPYKKSDNFNCFPAAFWLHRKRFFSWPFFGVLSHLVDLYLISNEEPSKGKKQIYLQCEGKNCLNTSRFAG